jgi:hypothetical protein
MAMAIEGRGNRVREDFLHLAFPLDEHDEGASRRSATRNFKSVTWPSRASPSASSAART